MPLLEVKELSVSFHSDHGVVHAVDSMSFDVSSGEILGIVGESGCGKSVTATSILGLNEGSRRVQGSIRLDGRELNGLPLNELREVRGRDVAMIFQDPMTSLNPVFTVGRQIGEVLVKHKGMTKKQALARSIELLDIADIPLPERRVKQYPHQLSGGMRQRVMIAMALACDAKLLIADEPTTALDVTVQAGILDLLRDVRDRLGTAVIIITHDLGVIADIADRVVVMYAGRKIEEAAVDDIYRNPQHPYTIGLLGAVPGRIAVEDMSNRHLAEIPGMVPTVTSIPGYCTFAARCPRADDRCRSEQPPITSIGMDHYFACFYPGEEA